MGSYNFGNMELYQEKQKITKRFEAIILALKELDQRGQYKEVVQRLSVALYSNVRDHGSLPVYSPHGWANRENYGDCAAALIGRFVITYWNFCSHFPERMEFLYGLLCELEVLAKEGFKDFKTEKSSDLKYRLVLK